MTRHAVGFLTLGFALALAFTAFLSTASAQDIPRSEHPRPDMARAEWLNLNGPWEFAETDDNTEFLGEAVYPDKIIVPFCRESALSGLARTGFVKNVWYRRTFEIPKDWKSSRVRLHIGACDYRSRVWINGTVVGKHTGGSAPFGFDITAALQPGQNTVIIHAFDDTRSGLQPCGKQSQQEKSHGCCYTRTTGIWQTVWLEGVGSSYIRALSIIPDPANKRALLNAEIDGPSQGLTLTATALDGDQEAGQAASPADWRHTTLVVNLKSQHLWTVKDPFLYGLKLVLAKDGAVVDSLDSYFGLRTVSIEGRAILINGEPIFQRTILDQGFYPDGIWTAPTDAALKHDIELSQAAGFNGARLHQKVFEPRFLYWADKLGYLVWGEFPNWGFDYNRSEGYVPYIDEWVEIVNRDRNHPAIVGWCPFNETPPDAEAIQNCIVGVTRAIDTTRPIIDSSGYHHGLAEPEVLDAHDYDQDPASFNARWINRLSEDALPPQYAGAPRPLTPFFVSEYGGIGWALEAGWGYGNAPKTLDEFYARYQGLTDAQLDNPNLFGFCYTQLTNIEQEQNGIYAYTREPKFDIARIHAINTRTAAYETNPPLTKPAAQATSAWRILVPGEPDGAAAKPWRYCADAAPAETWATPEFDDAKWPAGQGGFGHKEGWEKRIHTPWTSKDIWLRQSFTHAGDAFTKATLAIHYDNATEVYLNGTLIWKGEGWNDNYQGVDVTEAVQKSMKTGENLIAIHCHQDEGGQYIDAALLVR